MRKEPGEQDSARSRPALPQPERQAAGWRGGRLVEAGPACHWCPWSQPRRYRSILPSPNAASRAHAPCANLGEQFPSVGGWLSAHPDFRCGKGRNGRERESKMSMARAAFVACSTQCVLPPLAEHPAPEGPVGIPSGGIAIGHCTDSTRLCLGCNEHEANTSGVDGLLTTVAA